MISTKNILQIGNKGFSLAELMCAMVIDLLLIGAIFTSVNSVMKYNVTQTYIVSMNNNAMNIMNEMSRGIRSAGYDPKNKGFDAIASLSATSLVFNQAIDSDSTGNAHTVSYVYSASLKKITKAVDGATVVTFGDVNSLTFVPNAIPPQPTQIKINLIVQTEKPDSSYANNSGYRTKSLSFTVPINQ